MKKRGSIVKKKKTIIVCDSVLSGARDKWTKSERQICRVCFVGKKGG